VIQHPDGTLLFDSGRTRSWERTRGAARSAAADFQVRLSPEDHIESRLASIGLKRRHRHRRSVASALRPCGGLAWLTHAPILVQREESAFAFDPPVYQEAIYLRDDFGMDLKCRTWMGSRHLRRRARDGDLHPGHARAPVAARASRGTDDLPAADAAYLLAKLRSRSLPGVIWSPDAMIDTWDRIEEIERSENAT